MSEESYLLVVRGMPVLKPVSVPTKEQIQSNRQRGFYFSKHTHCYNGLPTTESTAKVEEESLAYKTIVEHCSTAFDRGIIPNESLDVLIDAFNKQHDKIKSEGVHKNLEVLTNLNNILTIMNTAKNGDIGINIRTEK